MATGAGMIVVRKHVLLRSICVRTTPRAGRSKRTVDAELNLYITLPLDTYQRRWLAAGPFSHTTDVRRPSSRFRYTSSPNTLLLLDTHGNNHGAIPDALPLLSLQLRRAMLPARLVRTSR